MADPEKIKPIIDELFQLTAPKIDDSRRSQITEFVDTTVNGDMIQAYLVINAALVPGRGGALIYILTNVRLVKIDIDDTNIKSSSPSLSTIVNVDRKIEGTKAQVAIYFQNDLFGLSYAADNHVIHDFFQKVDLTRAKVKN